MISLPVSIGEAFDKYSILVIKREKMIGEKKTEVEKELRLVEDSVKSYLPRHQLWFRHLYEINLKIWDWCELVRDSASPDYGKWCQKIIEYNDYRFTVKNKINLLSSGLKEQKSYAKRKALFLSHLGLGDQITLSAAVKALAYKYDYILVVGKYKHRETLEFIYRNDPNVGIVYVNENMDIAPAMVIYRGSVRFYKKMAEKYPFQIGRAGERLFAIFTTVTIEDIQKTAIEVGYQMPGKYDKGLFAMEIWENIDFKTTEIVSDGKNYFISCNYDDGSTSVYQYFVDKGYQMILSGCNLSGGFEFKLPFFRQIYADMGLEWEARFRYNMVDRDFDREETCFRKNGLEGKKYTFVHYDENSLHVYPEITLDPKKYYYHPNEAVDPKLTWEGGYRNIYDYGLLLERAEEIHIKDSCFFCLATNLDLSKVKRRVVYSREGVSAEEYLKGSGQIWEIVKPPKKEK